MDRLVYLATSSAGQDRVMETSLANNLANADTIGFKSDKVSFKSLYLTGGAKSVRVYSKADANGVDTTDGAVENTSAPLDIALRGNAWLSVTTPQGLKGYVHSASMHVDSSGVLKTEEGFTVNSANGSNITVPPGQSVSIDKTGSVNVIQNGVLSAINQLQLNTLPTDYVFKDQAGLIQVSAAHSGGVGSVSKPSVLSGALERSNVSPVEMLVKMMDLSRQYEANINEISTAKKTDSAANELLDVR